MHFLNIKYKIKSRIENYILMGKRSSMKLYIISCFNEIHFSIIMLLNVKKNVFFYNDSLVLGPLPFRSYSCSIIVFYFTYFTLSFPMVMFVAHWYFLIFYLNFQFLSHNKYMQLISIQKQWIIKKREWENKWVPLIHLKQLMTINDN